MSAYTAHPTAVIDAGAVIGEGTAIWHFSHICAGARIGSRCSFGQNTLVADGVIIGDGVKVQNNVSIYTGAVIEDDVSILQGVTLGGTGKETGDRHPKIRRGVLIGAGSSILGNIEIGHCARVAAGSVVLKPVPPRVTVAGVPARIVGETPCAVHAGNESPGPCMRCGQPLCEICRCTWRAPS